MDESEIYTQLGRLVRQHRQRLRMSQHSLAEAIELSRASVANIEAGRQHIPLHQLFRLARALKVDAFTLLPRKEVSGRTATLPKIKSSQTLSQREEAAIVRAVNAVVPTRLGDE